MLKYPVVSRKVASIALSIPEEGSNTENLNKLLLKLFLWNS